MQKPEVWLPEFTLHISCDCLLQWGLVYFTAHSAQCARNLTWHSIEGGHPCGRLQWQRYEGIPTMMPQDKHHGNVINSGYFWDLENTAIVSWPAVFWLVLSTCLFDPVEFRVPFWAWNRDMWYSFLNVFMCSVRASEAAFGEPHSWPEKSTSNPSKEERGAGQGSAPGRIYSHRWCADFSGLSLWVSWGLAGAPSSQVRDPFIHHPANHLTNYSVPFDTHVKACHDIHPCTYLSI